MKMVATMPLLPGYLPEGVKSPMDASEVYAAAEHLSRAGGVLLLTAMIMLQAPAALAAPLTWCACTALAFTAYSARDVISIIVAWAGYVRLHYWIVLAEPFLALLVVGVMWLFFVILIRPAV